MEVIEGRDSRRGIGDVGAFFLSLVIVSDDKMRVQLLDMDAELDTD